MIKTKVKTLQADLSKNAKIEYEEKSQFSQLVWAGMSNFTLVIGNYSFLFFTRFNNSHFLVIIGGETLETGVEKVDREEIPDYKEDFDQFIVRYIKGKLKEELIVRLKNGFPTTEREAAEFDEQKEKNDALYEAHVRKLISVCII